MFSFYDQLIIYLCEIRDRARLIARLVTKSRGLAKLNTVWYQQRAHLFKKKRRNFFLHITFGEGKKNLACNPFLRKYLGWPLGREYSFRVYVTAHQVMNDSSPSSDEIMFFDFNHTELLLPTAELSVARGIELYVVRSWMFRSRGSIGLGCCSPLILGRYLRNQRTSEWLTDWLIEDPVGV